MNKLYALIPFASLLLLVGCPYVDHGTSYAQNRLSTLAEASGCYYHEGQETYGDYSTGVYVCSELCIDTLHAYIHEIKYRQSEPELSDKYEDTTTVWDVRENRPDTDGTIKDGHFLFKTKDGEFGRKAVGVYNDGPVREIKFGLDIYSAEKGESKCEF